MGRSFLLERRISGEVGMFGKPRQIVQDYPWVGKEYAQTTVRRPPVAYRRHLADRHRADVLGLHVAHYPDAPQRSRRLPALGPARAYDLSKRGRRRRGPGLPGWRGPPVSPLLPDPHP